MDIVVRNIKEDGFSKVIIENGLKVKFPRVVKIKQKLFSRRTDNIQLALI